MAQVVLENPGAYIKTGVPSSVSETTPFIAGQAGSFVNSQATIAIPSQTTGLSAGQFPRVWQYVQLDASSAAPAFGQALVWKDAVNFVATTATSTARRNRAAGVLCNGSAVLGDYVWICVSGIVPVLVEAGQTPAAEDTLLVGPTTAGRWGFIVHGTAPTSVVYGTYLGAKTIAFNGSSALPADTAAAFINIPRIGF